MIILFDVDSTLVSIEGMDHLAKRKGLAEQVQAITKATMDGSMDFTLMYPKKIKLLAPSYEETQRLAQQYMHYLTPDIKTLIDNLQQQGHRVGLSTHSFWECLGLVVEELQLPSELIFANHLQFDDQGKFLDIPVEQDLMKTSGKVLAIQQLQNTYPDEKIVFVGDSAGDLKVQGIADLFIGCGIHLQRPVVQQQALHFVTQLDEIPPLLNKLS